MRHSELDFRGGAFAPPERARRHKPSAIEQMLRLAQGAAPGIGAATGGVLGGTAGAIIAGAPTAGVGAIPGIAAGATGGSALGGAAGSALGAGVGYLADQMGAEDAYAESERLAREEEKRARSQAALSILGGL